MTKFRKMPGQDQPVVERWPSFNVGWRFGVAVASAVVLSGTLLCTIGAVL